MTRTDAAAGRRYWADTHSARGGPAVKVGDQLNGPASWRTTLMLTVTGAEEDGCWLAAAPPAAEAGQNIGEGPVTAAPQQKAHGVKRHPLAAPELKAAIRPVRKTLSEVEGRRVHRPWIPREQDVNKPAPPPVHMVDSNSIIS